MFQTVNPATGQVVQTYEHASDEQVEKTLQKASENFQWWRKKALPERTAVVRKIAAEFRAQKEDLAKLMTAEMGKNHAEGVAEIEKCAHAFEYFADNAEGFLKSEAAAVEHGEARVHFEPLGPILSVMPWNFPFWQFVRFAAPSLVIGNVILLKHSTITAGCSQKIEELCNKVTERPLIFNLFLDHDQTAKVIAHRNIRGVTFTGSTNGGRSIAETAGKSLKKSVLELGGSDAYVILPDADIAFAAKKCAAGRMVNNGQSCIAAKRFIVVAEVFDAFVEAMKSELARYPMLPLAHEKFKKQLLVQVQKMQTLGGKLVLGNDAESKPHSLYPPSMLVFTEDDAEIHKEELFGPVAMVIKAKDVTNAFSIANSSPYGLGGGVFSKNIATAKELALTEIEAGFVAVNDTVRSDPALPFGGVKDSGYGRELSVHGFREFCNVKTVFVGT